SMCVPSELRFSIGGGPRLVGATTPHAVHHGGLSTRTDAWLQAARLGASAGCSLAMPSVRRPAHCDLLREMTAPACWASPGASAARRPQPPLVGFSSTS